MISGSDINAKLQHRSFSKSSYNILTNYGLSPLLARIYAARGIDDPRLITPDINNLLPPVSLKGINEAIELLIEAIIKKHKIWIVGDYDCDGATATSLLVSVLRKLNSNINYMIPQRLTMGYGLSELIANKLISLKPDLVITVDNGISSHKGVEILRKNCIKVLITDHHLPASSLPNANAIVNPNQPGCEFPSKCLAGVGVAFYVLIGLRQQLRQKHNIDFALGQYYDFVAIGTVADLVPLDYNNRILVHYGLKQIQGGKANVGVKALLLANQIDRSRVNASSLSFVIGPNLNAAGRLADMTLGIECLTCNEESKALQYAENLKKINSERKKTENNIKADAMRLINSADLNKYKSNKTISLYQPDWHLGVIGIVAARIRENTNKPTFIFSRDESCNLRGSGRSISNLNLRDCLDIIEKNNPKLLIAFGGHAMAVGVTISEKDFEKFSYEFDKTVAEYFGDIQSQHIVSDGNLSNEDINVYNLRSIENAVWGKGLPAPLFDDTFSIDNVKHLKNDHWKLRISNKRLRINALYFNAPERFNNYMLSNTKNISFTYTMLESEFQGVRDINLKIKSLL